MATLPARIVHRLRRHGPDYSAGLAAALGTTTGAVSGAITSLRRRGLIEIDHIEPPGDGRWRGRGRIYLRATVAGHELELPDDVDAPAPPRTTPAPPPAPPPPRDHPDGDLLGRLDRELALLRAERKYADRDGDETVALLMESNRSVCG